MNSFLKREIKDDLDLIERHIEKIENELIGYPEPKQIIHLYETYERLINVYRNNHVSKHMNKNDLDFYIKRRDILKKIKKKLRERMDYLFSQDKKTYKKLIYTYENMIRQYEVLYDTVRIIQVDTIHKLNISEVVEIDFIEIKDIELLEEIISYYNDSFKKSVVLKSNFTSDIEAINDELEFTYNEYNGKIDVRLKFKGRFIFVKFNKDIEFNIVFKNEKTIYNGKIIAGNKVVIDENGINFENDKIYCKECKKQLNKKHFYKIDNLECPICKNCLDKMIRDKKGEFNIEKFKSILKDMKVEFIDAIFYSMTRNKVDKNYNFLGNYLRNYNFKKPKF